MPTPEEFLDHVLARAIAHPETPLVADEQIRGRIEYVARCEGNRAGVRLLMACLLAKMHQPHVDPRQPYTEIGGNECFSGRTYDERYLTGFIDAHKLPCNSTTAFLTPALRNIDRPLTTNVTIVGRPAQVYQETLQILADVAERRASAEDVLTDTIRSLIAMRDEKAARMATLLAGMKPEEGTLPLSSEEIVTLLAQHLACKNSSRLPVLVVAAAYHAASGHLGEYARPLESHNAADEQTGAVGDVEICLTNDDRIVTAYEMKMKRVTADDMNRALQKIGMSNIRIDSYIFITTDAIDPLVMEYATSLYEKTSGTEIAILDCLSFLRHFLHLFHRLRIVFLNAYQDLLLAEPDSAVRQPLKEAFLSLRRAAESES